MNSHRLIFIILFFIFYAFAGSGPYKCAIASDYQSQPDPGSDSEDKSDPEGNDTIEADFRSFPLTSLKSGQGEAEIFEYSLRYSRDFKVCNKLPVKFALTQSYVDVEDNTNLDIPPYLVGLKFDVETTLPFFKLRHIYFRSGISPSFYSGEWHINGSTFRMPSRYFLIFHPDNVWTFICGLAVYPDYERQVLPIAGFIYKPNDKIEFYLLPQRPNISYFLSERLRLFIEGDLLSNEFEVTKDDSNGTVLTYKRGYLSLGTELKINRDAKASVSFGESFGRYLKYRDAPGKLSLRNSFCAELRFQVSM
ncbi:MAG: hypothetical protein JW788_05670 [Candidatus Omnitrophica bacterium]|nr:hypothetical protein [Candidatus Omnitrophota bacterium]